MVALAAISAAAVSWWKVCFIIEAQCLEILMTQRLFEVQAQHLYMKDVHYLVKGTVAVIIDESTGRAAAQARWVDGIHQARRDAAECSNALIRHWAAQLLPCSQ
jgi:preprotein translocase subunit SecA